MSEQWQRARLIPASSSRTSDENEQRATSALLAVLGIIPVFAKSLLTPLGASITRNTTIETFIETTFDLPGGGKVRPDGLIRISRPKHAPFVALVEVKTGRNTLNPEQLNSYIEVARSEGFDCIWTISNEIPPQFGVHPTSGIHVRSNSKVKVHHLSWTSILTAALMEKVHRGVSDPEQSWILGELIRYLEHPASGAMDFDDMGPHWATVRNGVRDSSLSKRDESVGAIALRWDQLVRYVSLKLGGAIGEDVQELVSRQHRIDPSARTKHFADELVASGCLSGILRVPDTADDLHIKVDLKARQIVISSEISAPDDRGSRASITWLTRQLRDSPDATVVSSYARNSSIAQSTSLETMKHDPSVLLPGGKKAIGRFEVSIRSELGIGRRSDSSTSFVNSLIGAVVEFYGGVLQSLQAYRPRAPRLQQPMIEVPSNNDDLAIES